MNTLYSLLERCLPTRALSGLIHRIAKSESRFLSRFLINGFIRRFPDSLAEAAEKNAQAYSSFNAFFTRALEPDARPVAGEAILVSPADGAIHQIGTVNGGRIVQAKNRFFTIAELLGTSAEDAGAFSDGSFVTIYLAPTDYHRVHAPADAVLAGITHLPGRLLSVRESNVSSVPRLYARNERVVCLFESDAGPLAVAMVGAFGVGSVSISGGPDLLRARRVNRHLFAESSRRSYSRGEELGCFNLGSTVIMISPRQTWVPQLGPGSRVVMGQRLA